MATRLTSQVTEALTSVASFTDSELRTIAQAGTLVTVPAQWAPMAQGTPADKVYVLVSGEVSVRKNKEEVARLTPGSIVGELAFERKSLRTATVVTETPATVLHFTPQAWKELLTAVPRLASVVGELTRHRTAAV